MYHRTIAETSNIAWHRPQSDIARVEDELIDKSNRALSSTTDPLERLRLLCLSRGATGIMRLSRVFRALNDNGSLKINKEEFFAGIKDAGLELEEAEAEEIFNSFDPDETELISVDELIRKLRPPMSDSRKAIVELVYRKLDKENNGFIELSDLRRLYSVNSHPRYMSGEESAETVLNCFIANFEKEGPVDGKVTLEEFMNYYSGISVSIDTDGYFDLMMRQAYKL